MRYAALLDGNDDVANVVVCPADRDPVQHLAAMGLAGTWRDAGEGRPTAGRGMRFWQGGYYRHWFQIEGADTGPEGEESGFPVGAELWHNGAVRVSRFNFNVNEPLDDAPTTWSRKDGRYVIPAGWEYQPGEDVTEDGETWWRVVQATSFAPSASPAQYQQIDGQGGEPVGGDDYPEWVQPTGGHDAYSIGDRVMFEGAAYESLINDNVWSPSAHPAGWQAL